MDFTTTDTAKLTGISRRLVTHIYGLFRDKIRQWVWQETPFTGTIEVDESYFGPRRIPDKRGLGIASKTMVFGLYKRNGKVYTEIVPNTFYSLGSEERFINFHLSTYWRFLFTKTSDLP